MKQVYHPYQTWEGYKNGMYEPCKPGRADRVMTAKNLLASPKKLQEYMALVTVEWPNETEQVLTDMSVSHRAWLGQSACNLYAGVREDETREAWGYLSNTQRAAANKAADTIDKRWRESRETGNAEQLSLLDAMEEWQ